MKLYLARSTCFLNDDTDILKNDKQSLCVKKIQNGHVKRMHSVDSNRIGESRAKKDRMNTGTGWNRELDNIGYYEFYELLEINNL